jgi:hypothetical protein
MTGHAYPPLPPDEPPEPLVEDEGYFADIYRKKVARIKRLVEYKGMELEDALRIVLTTPPILFLPQLREEAEAHYGRKG